MLQFTETKCIANSIKRYELFVYSTLSARALLESHVSDRAAAAAVAAAAAGMHALASGCTHAT